MSSSSSTTQDRLRRKLAWTRPVWLAILGAIQRASTPITAIEERDAEDFSLNPYLKQLEDAEFYEIVYDHSSDRKDDHKIKDCMGEVNEHLRNGALTFRACQKGTYVFWDIISNILKGDKNVVKLRWMRKQIQPQRIFIICEDEERFVWDPSGDQFGLPDWFYTAKEYKQSIEMASLDPVVGTAEHEKTTLEKEEPRLRSLKAAVQQVVADAEAEWEAKGVKLHESSDHELEKLRHDLVAKIEKRMVKLLEEWSITMS
ncbi:hypothetical protein K491DRAFT_673076 [Lophiostoma macrostomum CBS 122681]|uniref:Uncharacterized protein n=1 Tax=Lophiostoma macrostomum CBS 122681 TaxID=1314788 RepID=A0A6A6TT06_9PLEO|nr:hypothetical protein K491DRAFT_673076 [Lophiostoma macrostomum CBS 122681]